MMTIDAEVCIGLAYLEARNHSCLNHNRAYKWAKKHWPEFLPQFGSVTGQLLLRIGQQRRNQEKS